MSCLIYKCANTNKIRINWYILYFKDFKGRKEWVGRDETEKEENSFPRRCAEDWVDDEQSKFVTNFTLKVVENNSYKTQRYSKSSWSLLQCKYFWNTSIITIS